MPPLFGMPRLAAAVAIVFAAGLAATTAFAQQASITGRWGATAQGPTFPISITLGLLPTGQFQQDLQSGTAACLHSLIVGNFGILQQPNVFRFNITGQEPAVDCTGHQVVRQAGWTAQLQLLDANTLVWHDMETGNSITFRRLQ